jgi:hypothetical protein
VSTATEIWMRQAEANRRWDEACALYLKPMTDRLGQMMFSRRGQAIYFGIKREPQTDDMRQMLADLR